ncbi:MAG: nitrogen fixation protein FixH [Caldimonas sp.]
MPARVFPQPLVTAAPPEPAAAWWRFGIVWLALGGPAVVVVASLVTMAIAFNGADPIVPEARVPVVSTLGSAARATAPAQQIRNHAATPSP